jgi:AcrR family transcriptional regulator
LVAGIAGIDGVMVTDSVDFDRVTVKNRSSQSVRKRTSASNRPNTGDRRVRRTRTSLQDALIGLAGEKPYHKIAVTEILNRANVGRSTFYQHFRDKDELLLSGIHEVLRTRRAGHDASSALEHVLAFSRSFLDFVDRHRHAHNPGMTDDNRATVHAHLRDVLTDVLEHDFTTMRRRSQPATSDVPVALVARYVASTFVLVLDWWVESGAALTPAEVDARFRALVLPTLTTLR